MKKITSNFNKILIIATRQIGDVLCTTPLMRRTRELWPNAVIDVLGYEKTMGMLAGNPDINQVIESPEHPKWPEYRGLIKRIFRKYDLSIVTQPSDRAHVYGLLAAPKRVGIVPTSKSHNWWKKLLSLHSVELDYWRQHVVIERLALLDPFLRDTLVPPSNQISLVPPARLPLPESIQSFLGSGSFVVFHATPMWRFKRWPSQHWAELAQHFTQSGYKVVLSGSGSDQDRRLNAEIVGLLPSDADFQVVDASGLLNLGQLAELLGRAALFVGVDTSVTHLAVAMGTSTVGLFGATTPTNFGPWPQKSVFRSLEKPSVWQLKGSQSIDDCRTQTIENVTLVQGPGPCVPCRKAGCLDKFESHSDCLDRLSVRAVINACNQ